MYKKGERNVHADVLSCFKILAETTADDWDETRSFLLDEHHSERTKINRGAKTVVQSKLHSKQIIKDIRQQHVNDATCDPTHLENMAPDELLTILPVPTPADPMLEPISEEERATAQFHNVFCVDIRRRFSNGWRYRCVIKKTEYCAVSYLSIKKLLHTLWNNLSVTFTSYARSARYHGGKKLY